MARISDPHESQSAPQPQPSNGKTIVLAEDDPFIGRMYQTKLTLAGFKVVVATNGREAVEQITALRPDLVMLDIGMPELTGFQVLGALQASNSLPDPDRIIVLTNSANPADRQQAAKWGVEYLLKAELTPHDVLELVMKRLGMAA
jgi:CheY-like chemotaxis protein